MLIVHRTALRRRVSTLQTCISTLRRADFHSSPRREQTARDPRLGHVLEDDFATLRDSYEAPKHPIILAHGLLGFDELHLAGKVLPGVHYWYGITEALAAKGIEVITAAVPPSGRIEVRAERLAEVIERKAGGKAVNIVA